MIGILYTADKRKKYTERLHSLLIKSGQGKYDPIIAFSISDIDFTEGKVCGNLISEDDIKPVTVPIPPIVYNLALNEDKNSIIKQRYLSSMKDIKLINDVNKFDQWMIMEMVSSSPCLNKYILPYHVYDKVKKDFKPDENLSYIAIPERGASLSRIIYTRLNPKTGKLEGNQYFKKGHICDYIDASLCQKRWIFIELPEIVTCENTPVVVRVYLQRGLYGRWMVLKRGINLKSKSDMGGLNIIMEGASLRIIDYISNFLPDLGYCFMDFIVGKDRAPYFLHLGGAGPPFFV